MPLIEFRKSGLYCPQADVYIDAWKKVNKTLITHAHSDHARWGHQQYICAQPSTALVKHRVNSQAVHGVPFGERFQVNGVSFSFHPAGHIVGSAQIRVEHRGEVWVISGDYKIQADNLCEAFEPIKCHSFITESTFGLPVYKWQSNQLLFDQVNNWWNQNKQEGRTSLLLGYSLGKAQRLLSGIDPEIGPIYTHGAVETLNEIIRASGYHLPMTSNVTTAKPSELAGALVVAPPSAFGSPWMKRFKKVSVASASGWMQLRGARRRRGVDRGFVISDHADWDGLNAAISATEAEHIYVTHGYTEIFSQWLNSQGISASVVSTAFEGEQQAENQKDENQ